VIWQIDEGERAIEGLDANGRPDPAYARALGLLPAPLGRRVLASLLELCVAVLITLPALIVAVPVLTEIAGGSVDPAALARRGDVLWTLIAIGASNLLITAYTIVQLILHGRKGVTLGKAVFGIRSVNVRTLERPGFWRGAVVRYLVASASFIVPLIGPLLVIALSPLFDREGRGRGWLDVVAATWLVDARRGLNPYDRKRMRIARKSVHAPEQAQSAALPSLATPVAADAPAAYTPGARFSGGVLGAHHGASAPVMAPAQQGVLPDAPGSFSPQPIVPPSFVPSPNAVPGPDPVLGVSSAAPSPAPAAPGAAGAAPAQRDVARAVVALDTGERIEVRGVTLIGRDPSPAAGETVSALVPLHDETRTVSKTHLGLMPARRGILAVDRASTNGSAVIRDGSEIPLLAGQPVELRRGDTVRFGDRTLIVEAL